MNAQPRPIIQTALPETAPFTPEQRAWLSGFFSGLISLDSGTAPIPLADATTFAPPSEPAGPLDDGDDGSAPWHDQTLSINERMVLAAGRPLRRRMMAAMAQQDCGQCGYTCEDYSNALALRAEARLNLCVPGGKETARMLKTLHEELEAAPATQPVAKFVSPAETVEANQGQPGRSRDNPLEATFLSRTRLNKPGSEKETWHIEFDLTGSGLDYAVGDSFGLFPTNDPALVDSIIAALRVPSDFPIAGRTLREVLVADMSLAPAPDSLFQLISYLTGGDRRQKAKALAAGDDPDGDAASLDVLAALEKFSGLRSDPEAFIEALEPLQPRLYSISSSPKVDRNRLSLTVDAVRYIFNQRTRLGVA
ncbi:MAG TPA: sulfite reductase subunit alpha, partial [Xanthobacteraceae bacterium]|nr:sulfite reductase subunit alpha [Xanthobacteraceae bacterium]